MQSRRCVSAESLVVSFPSYPREIGKSTKQTQQASRKGRRGADCVTLAKCPALTGPAYPEARTGISLVLLEPAAVNAPSVRFES